MSNTKKACAFARSLHLLPVDDDRLRGGDADEHGQQHERGHHRDERPPRGAADAEDRAHLQAAPLDEEQRCQRDRGRDREQRRERGEERDAEERERHQ